MRVLIVTNMYPTPQRPDWGVFVYDQVESLRALGVEIDVLDFSAGGRVSVYVQAIRALRQKLSRQKNAYDLIHAHYGHSGLAARFQTALPVIVTFHGNDLVPQIDSKGRITREGRVGTLVGKLAALAATRCILVAELLRPLIWPRRAADIIPMGVDLDVFKPMERAQACQELGLPVERKRVVFVAHPDNFIKRYSLAKAAVEHLQQQGQQVDLLPVYGVRHSQVPLYLNASDALILTSLQEASPTVIKEALACNLPIVATNAGDTAERLRGVQHCVVCPPDAGKMAAKLALAVNAGRSANGRDSVQALSLPNIARRVLDVYQHVAAK